jgi:putative DNA primase/helicase
MTIDLEIGQYYDARAEDHCTKIAATAPDPLCPIETWLRFLDRVTDGDGDLQSYLQRVAGYCMTGHTSEHVLFFLYGTGANGKSVFVNTLAGIWNDYAVTAPVETFTESRHDRHPTELARLRGARLVIASETEAGRNWNEARIKAITGGDKVAARFMRADFFEYQPQFKLLISGNHKPAIRNVDEAMRRRIHLIPFAVIIPSDERDPDLQEKLKEEWPGILQWAVQGCLEWRSTGLNPPEAVRKATEQYLAEEDDMQSWFTECCEIGTAFEDGSSTLYNSWKRWAERTGRVGGAGSQKAFSQAMLDKGFESKRTRTGKTFLGLKVSQQAEDWQAMEYRG